MSKHGLSFYIEGAKVSVDEMGEMVAGVMQFDSEHEQELFAHDAAHAIFDGIARKVAMASAAAEKARVRRLWIADNPPNHAGYYYCHIGGEWVHIDAAELDHIVPSSVERINTDDPDWQDKMRMACIPHNRWKGSKIVPSATREIRPPDEEC